MIKRNFKNRALPKQQKGVALITVMIVLFILTLLGLAATDSSNFQALMVRNNQFRLEVFNASRAEIQQQILAYQADDDRTVVFNAIDNARISTSDNPAPANLNVQTQSPNYVKVIALSRTGGCSTFNTSIGSRRCDLLQLDSDAQLDGTNIASQQSQTFSFESF